MRFTRFHAVASVAGLLSGPALVFAEALARRSVECFFDVPADSGDTCETLASGWGISVEEFININPGVTCPDLEAGKSYCVVGEYTPDEPTTPTTQPQPPAITTIQPPTTTSTQPPTTFETTTTTTSAAEPEVTPIMPGAAENCNRYYKIRSGDTCDAVASRNGITVSQLKSWNTEINDSCSNLWLDYYVCTGISGATAPPSTTTSGPPESTVSPIMPGADANCDRYYKIESGDTCDAVASKNGITVAQLKTWNTEINAACSNLWLDYYVCTRVPGASVPPTSTAPPTPSNSPQLPGAVSNCNKWYKISSGDTCDNVAAKNQITVAMLRSYNTQINASTFTASYPIQPDRVL